MNSKSSLNIHLIPERIVIGFPQELIWIEASAKRNQFYVGGRDHKLSIIHADGKESKQTLKGHYSALMKMAISPQENYLAVVNEWNNNVKIWDLNKKQIVYSLGPHESFVRSVTWSPDQKYVATTSEDKKLRIWKLGEDTPIMTWESERGALYGVDWSPKGDLLSVGASDGSIHLITPEGNQEFFVTGHNNWVLDIEWHPNGQWFASSSWDKTVRVWSVDTGREIQRLIAHNQMVRSVTWIEELPVLISAGEDGKIIVWDVQENKLMKVVKDHVGKALCATNLGTRKLASVGEDRSIRVYDMQWN